MTAAGAGWYWRFNMGGSGHWVPAAERDQGSSLWVAAASSPCGQAQGAGVRPGGGPYRGTVLQDPTRHPVYFEHACRPCRAYCQRHGVPLPPPLDGALVGRLTTIGYDLAGATALLADLRQHGLDLVLKS